MPDSPLFNVGRPRPRKSFLDDTYVGDDRLAGWAEETGRLAPVEREGSTFYEDVDPETGAKRYYGRKNSAGTDDLPSTAKTMSVGGKPFVTKDKVYKPTLTNARAMSFRADFNEDMDNKKSEAERLRAKAELIEAEDRQMANQLKLKREGSAIDREGRKGDLMDAIEARKLADPLYESRQMAEREAFTQGETQKQQAQMRRESLARGDDIPGVSKGGERAMADELESGGDLNSARRAAREGHEREVAMLRQLEQRGDPTSLADAKRMRDADPDLQRVESFIRPRDAIADESAIVGELSPFLDATARTADDASWFSDFADYQDLSQQERTGIATSLDEKLLKLRSLGIDSNTIRSALASRMFARGFPREYVQAITALVQ